MSTTFISLKLFKCEFSGRRLGVTGYAIQTDHMGPIMDGGLVRVEE